ncbi:hypothetical protein RAX54_004533 [Vibrio parahaemolyticus]|nr:hypothetical protein [Vibrio parahaemolyticus]
MSKIQHLFDSSGDWLGFRIGKNVYNSDADWVAWLPWGDDDVVTTDGDYLGTITNGNRLYHFSSKPYRGYPGYPGYPGFAGYSPLPFGARDVTMPKPE